MDTILSIFEFTSQSLTLLFARFGIELLCTLVVAYLVALILLHVTKKKDHEIGFSVASYWVDRMKLQHTPGDLIYNRNQK